MCSKLLTNHVERPGITKDSFICWYCGEEYDDKIFLEMHIKIDHGEILYSNSQLIWYSCKLCSKLYSQSKYICRHMRHVHSLHPHSDAEEYIIRSLRDITSQCKQCYKPCLFSNVCSDHTEGIDVLISETCEDHIENKLSHACQVCNSVYTNCSSLWTHMFRLHKKEARFSCNLCLKRNIPIRFPSEIVVHMRRKHEKLLSLENITRKTTQKDKARIYIDGILKHRCSHCQEIFDGANDINRHFIEAHKDIKHKSRLYNCNICFESFALKKQFRNHYRNAHNKLLLYECKDCSREFSFKSQLTRHMISHTRERGSVCEQCGAAFSQPAGLYNHMFTHDNTRYPCSMCERSYTHPSLLKVHMKTHTDTNRYVCEICGKDFSTVRNLKRHKLTHNPLKSFVCSLCNTGFTVKKYLIQHYKTHRKE